MSTNLKVSIGGKRILDLSSAGFHYVGAGGQASIYEGSGTAFKVYHDPRSMIPLGKIQELMKIQAANVVRPFDVLYAASGGQPVGYAMKYLDHTNPICKLFAKSFKTENSIFPSMVVELVKAIQMTVASVHRDNCLIVDLNELNVLVGDDFVSPFVIDTDSFQTPSFRATAIMDSVRDRHSPPGQFSETTDWFSFAVMATHLYLNIHPFKGTHPKYLPSEMNRRMDDNVSIFCKDVKLPIVCNPLSVIPRRHLDWLKLVFLKKERSVPPLPDVSGPIPVPANIVLVSGTDKFEIGELFSLDDDILFRMEFFGVDYFVTRKSVFKGTEKVWTKPADYRKVLVCPADSGDIVIAGYDGRKTVQFLTADNQALGQVSSRGFFFRNQAVYTANRGRLYENTFTKMGEKLFVRTHAVDQLSEFGSVVYPGVVVQDLLGKIWVTIPYAPGRCCSRPVPQLDGYRVIDARSEMNLCVVIGEKRGIYSRFVLTFAPDFSAYALRQEDDAACDGINFTVLENGLCLMLGGPDELQVFKGTKVHKFSNPPIAANMRLFAKSGGVCFLNGSSVFSLKMVKCGRRRESGGKPAV
jgi:hypothetical protein